MKKIGFLGKYNLLKDRRQFISFGVILFITAFILNTGLVLNFNVGLSYDKLFEDLNASNVDVMISKLQNSDALEKKLSDVRGVKEVERNNALFTAATAKDFRDVDFEMNTIFYNIDNHHNMNQLETVEELKEGADNPIYLPLYIAEFGQYELGSHITYQIEEKTYTFTVAGIVQEMQYGNYGCGLMGVYLPRAEYKEFFKGFADKEVVIYSIKTAVNTDSKEIMNAVTKVLDSENIKLLKSSYDDMTKESRMMVCKLIIAILMVFSAIILVVSVFLCSFHIKNTIDENIANMGVQKALGYTSHNIIAAIIYPYALISCLAIITGIIASSLVLPVLLKIIELQAGFHLVIGFDLRAGIITFILLSVFVIGFTYISARKIKKLNTINAIRGIDETKLSCENHLPIDKTIGNINIILMLKQGIASLRQNVLVFLVIFIMTVLISFGGVLFYNVIIEPDNFMSSMSDESPSIIVKTAEGKTEALKEKLGAENSINMVLKYDIINVKIESDSVPAFICEDFDLVSSNLCYEGKNPKEADEIAIGSSIAVEKGYEIGDTIKVTYKEELFSYTIVGLLQSVNYNGNLIELTESGLKKVDSEYSFKSLYVYLNDEGKAASFADHIKDKYSTDAFQVINYYSTAKTSKDMYSQIIKVVIVLISGITLLIVFLILYVTIKSMLVRRKQELGIYKAIGYSSRQLIMQMAGSFMPAAALAAFSSAALGYIYMPNICNVIFKGIGIMKNQMQVQMSIQLLFAAVLVIASFILCICLSLRIKNISACSLIRE